MVSARDDYRAYASHCAQLAQTAGPEQRALLIEMAQAWIRLADMTTRIEKLSDEAPDIMVEVRPKSSN
jgi:hypothetical protein